MGSNRIYAPHFRFEGAQYITHDIDSVTIAIECEPMETSEVHNAINNLHGLSKTQKALMHGAFEEVAHEVTVLGFAKHISRVS